MQEHPARQIAGHCDPDQWQCPCWTFIDTDEVWAEDEKVPYQRYTVPRIIPGPFEAPINYAQRMEATRPFFASFVRRLAPAPSATPLSPSLYTPFPLSRIFFLTFSLFLFSLFPSFFLSPTRLLVLAHFRASLRRSHRDSPGQKGKRRHSSIAIRSVRSIASLREGYPGTECHLVDIIFPFRPPFGSNP